MGLGEHVLGENDGWCSPEDVLAPLERCFGVDFDPAGNPSNIFARSTVMLPGYMRPADEKRKRAAQWIDYWLAPKVIPTWAPNIDRQLIWASGLDLGWAGRGFTYVNPPFSDIAPWLAKMREVDEGVMLLPARMNAGYLHDTGFPHASAVLFPRRRIQFVGATTQPPWHSMLLYYGARPHVFRALYELELSFGVVLPVGEAANAGWGRLASCAA